MIEVVPHYGKGILPGPGIGRSDGRAAGGIRARRSIAEGVGRRTGKGVRARRRGRTLGPGRGREEKKKAQQEQGKKALRGEARQR